MKNTTVKRIKHALTYGANQQELTIKFGGRLVAIVFKNLIRVMKEQPFDKNRRWYGSKGRLFRAYRGLI